MKKITLLFSGLLLMGVFTLKAADYYWVGDGGNWSDTSHWATTSGGAVKHNTPPTSSDNVYFDANSFSMAMQSVNLDAFASCQNMDWTGVTNMPDLGGFNSLNIYGSLTFDPGMTCSMNGGFQFYSDDPGNTIDIAGVSIPNAWSFGFNGDGNGEWTFLSDVEIGSIMFNNGIIYTNGYTLTTGNINIMGGNINQELHFGTSVINTTGLNIMAMPGVYSIDADSAILNITNSSDFNGGDNTFHVINITGISFGNEYYFSGSNTIDTLRFDSIPKIIFEEGSINTIEDIVFNGNCANPVTIMTSIKGNTAYFNKSSGTVNEDYLAIRDFTIMGGAVFTSNHSTDLGNVNNWTINSDASQTYYWVGDGGSWNDPAHWALSSGGAGNGVCVPTVVDDVVFDANSFTVAGQNVEVNGTGFCHNMTWTGVTNTPTFKTLNFFGDVINISGSLTFSPNMTSNFSGEYHFNSPDAGIIITSANLPLTATNNVRFQGGGEWTLADTLICGNLFLEEGTLITNDNHIRTSTFQSSTGLDRELFLGNSTIQCSGNWYILDNTNMTLNSGNSNIYIDGNGFYGGNFDYANMEIGSPSLVIYDNNAFDTLSLTPGSLIQLNHGDTQTVEDIVNSGDCANYDIIRSYTPGSLAYISKSSGTLTLDYVKLRDCGAIGGATFNATNAIDLGNNPGWNFTPPAGADYYWVGGGGNWNDDAHWSTTSGGAPDACIPSEADNVHFDSNSGLSGLNTVDVNTEAGCNNFDWNTGGKLSGSYSLHIFGSMSLNSSMQMSYCTSGSGKGFKFNSSAGGNTINTDGETITSHIYFEGSGGWTLQSALTTNREIFLNEGTLNTNDSAVNAVRFHSTTDKTRTLNLGNSTVTLSSASAWVFSGETNLTVNAGTSTLNMNGAGYFYGGSQTYYDVNFSSTGYINFKGDNTFNDVVITSSKNIRFEGEKTQTFNSLSIPNGTGCNGFVNVSSLNAGVPATISMSSGTFTGDYLNITDVTATGGATFNATNSIGNGDVSGWNITPYGGTTLYWIGGSGSWTDTSHWSASSGGTVYGCLPTTEDDVVFDANSFADQDTVLIYTSSCKSIDFTAAPFTPVIQGSGPLTINGSMTFIPNMVVDNMFSAVFISSDPGNTVTTGSHTLGNLDFSGSGDYTLQDDITFTGWIAFNSGTLNTNDQNITGTGMGSGFFQSFSTANRTLNLGSSAISVNYWDISDPANMTLNAGTSGITIEGWQFRGGDLTYNNVTLNSVMGATIYDDNTFNTLTINPSTSVLIDTNTTQTVTSLIATGNPSGYIQLKSQIPGIQGAIQQSSDFCGDYLKIQDINASGADFYACSNSFDLGNNTGWTFLGDTVDLGKDTAICQGDTIILDAGAGDSYLWSTTETTQTIKAFSTDNYSVTVTSGCCDATGSVNITVNPNPIVDLGVDQTICDNDTTTLDAGAGFTDYFWTGGATTQTLDISTAGTYGVTVTNADGCTGMDEADVSVTPIPDAGVSDSIVVCFNGSGFTMRDSLDGTPDAGGAWFDPGMSPFGGTYNPAVHTGGTYTYIVTAAPCENDTAELVISENPDILVENDTAICVATDYSLEFDVSGGDSATYNVAGITGTWNKSSYPYHFTSDPIAEGTPYSVTVTDAYNCNPVVLSGNKSCSCPVSATMSGTGNLCRNSGDTVNITITLAGGTIDYDTLIYAVDGVNDTMLNVSNTVLIVPVDTSYGTGTINLSLIKVYDDGCSGTVTGSGTVTITDPPDAGTNSTYTACSIDPAFNLIDHLNGTPDPAGSWHDPGMSAFGGVFTPGTDAAGVYTYIVTGTGGCTNDTAEVDVTVNTAPDAGDDNAIVVCNNASAFDLVDSLGGSPDISGSWLDPGMSPYSGTFDPASDASGTYYYVVTGTAPCDNDTSELDVTVDVCTDMQELPTTAGLNVYPNPSTGTFIIDYGSGVKGKVTIAIYTLSGQIMYKEQVDSKGWIRKEFNVQGWNKGVYILQLSEQQTTRYERIMID